MIAPHLIERLDIEIAFDPPDPELHAEQPLLRLLRETLLPVLDEVLDACDEPGTVLVLPALDLDLGTIERGAWKTQAPARLRALLEDAIAAARQQARLAIPGAADRPRIHSTGEDALARLAAFLRSGRLGWDAPLERADLHSALLGELLATERAALLRMLAGAAVQPAALRRLAEQFPRHQLEAILDAAAPRQARALRAWLAAQARPQAATRAWSLVLGVALGAHDAGVGLTTVAAAIAHAQVWSGPPAMALAEGQRLAAWWRRGERDAAAQDLLERLLVQGGADEDQVRAALARLLGAALSTPDGARRLAAALPLRLRERLLRFLAPGPGPRMLALAGEVERHLVARVGDRGRAAAAHARCWQALLAASLGALGGVVREDLLRARLAAIVDAAAHGAVLPGHAEPGLADATTPGELAPGELVLLAAFLERGRFDDLPPAPEGAQASTGDGRHVVLLERLLAGARDNNRLREALLRMLGVALASPAALRRLATQFPQRQLADLVRAAAPGPAAALLALLLESLDAASLQAPADDEATRAAWQGLLVRALRGDAAQHEQEELEEQTGKDGQAGQHGQHGQDRAPPGPDGASGSLQSRLEAWWGTGRFDAAGAVHLAHLLARAGRSGVDAHLRQALSGALATTLAASDGGMRLARALPERLREALLWFALPAMAPRAVGALQRRRAHGGGGDGDSWIALLAASLAPAASAAAVQALCDDMDPAAAGLAELDALEAWWRSGHADAARALRMERLLARAAAAGVDGGPARALAAALARTVALPEGPRRLAAAIPEQLGSALLWCLAPALAPRLVALLHDLRRRLASRPGAYRDCWALVYALCFSGAPSAAAVDALCRRLDAAAPQGPAAQEDAGELAVARADAMLDELEAWWRSGQPDPGRAAQLERLLAFDVSDPPGALDEAARAALRAALAAAVRRTLASPGGARRLVSAVPEYLRVSLLARLAPGFANAVVGRLRALGRWLASTPSAAGPAPGLHAICWAEVLVACLSPTVTSASVQALCARLDALPAAAAPARTVSDVERLAAFLRRGRLLGARARQAGNDGTAGTAGDDHVALLDRLLAASSLQPLWRMLAASLQRPAQARRLVDQFPERQLREVVARAAPAQAAGLLALLDALPAAGPALGLAPRRRRAWMVLLAAAVRAAAGLAPFPGMKALRRDVLDRFAWPDAAPIAASASSRWQPGPEERRATRALKRLLSEAALARAGKAGSLAQETLRALRAPPARAVEMPDGAARRMQDECAALAAAIGPPDGAQLLARIRDHLARDRRMAPGRQAVMVDAIAAAAGDGGSAQACLRLVLDRLRSGATIDLEAIARQASAGDGIAPAAAAAAGPRGAIVMALLAAEGDPPPPAWRALLETRRDEVLRVLRATGRRRAWRAALRDGLPQAMLADLVELARPDLGAAVRAMSEREMALAGVLGSGWRAVLWRAAFGLAARPGQPAAPDRASACIQVLRAAAPDEPARASLLDAWRAAALPAPRPAPVAKDAQASVRPGERIALDNAGMVLMAPYLPRLFAMLGLVADGVFVDLDAAERAVHLLQFAVSGAGSTPEYALPLNKLLCGLPLDAPVAAGIDLTVDERETVEGLLEAMIAAWSALGRTSVEGLRQSFLMRGGELSLGAQGWELAVAHGPFDMLMDRLPWSFSIVRFGWMPAPLHVSWN